jgi:arylsulfatase
VPEYEKDNSVQHESLWWLQEGSRAIRVGDWKLVAASPSLRGRGGGNAQAEKEPGQWELFNLADDRAETNNLAAKMPEKVRELAELWTKRQNEFFKLAQE